jgi:excisionase family DNA binding protein
MESLLVPIWPDAGRALGVGRTTTFQLIATGRLRTVRIGRRRLVPVRAIHDLVDGLDQVDRSVPTDRKSHL